MRTKHEKRWLFVWALCKSFGLSFYVEATVDPHNRSKGLRHAKGSVSLKLVGGFSLP